MAEIYEIHQLFREITENISKIVVESDEDKRLATARIVQNQLDRGLREMRETITRINLELKSEQYGGLMVTEMAKEAMPARPKFDFEKISTHLKNAPQTTGDVLHFLAGIGYFDAKE